MKTIGIFLTGHSSEISLDVELTTSDKVETQHCPITSVKIKSSFCRYKAVLNRRFFKFEIVKLHIFMVQSR